MTGALPRQVPLHPTLDLLFHPLPGLEGLREPLINVNTRDRFVIADAA